MINIPVDEAKTLLSFLARSTVQGSEVATFIKVVGGIEQQLIDLENPKDIVGPPGKKK